MDDNRHLYRVTDEETSKEAAENVPASKVEFQKAALSYAWSDPLGKTFNELDNHLMNKFGVDLEEARRQVRYVADESDKVWHWIARYHNANGKRAKRKGSKNAAGMLLRVTPKGMRRMRELGLSLDSPPVLSAVPPPRKRTITRR